MRSGPGCRLRSRRKNRLMLVFCEQKILGIRSLWLILIQMFLRKYFAFVLIC